MRRARHGRIFTALDSEALLQALGECRRACIKAHAAAPIGGPKYQGVDKIMDAIDDMAGLLTGNREHFHAKPHSATMPTR